MMLFLYVSRLLDYWVEDILTDKLASAAITWNIIGPDVPDHMMTRVIAQYFAETLLTPGGYAAVLATQKGNVNVPSAGGVTMLMKVLYFHTPQQSLRILLADSRIDGVSAIRGCSPFDWAVFGGNAYGVRALIARQDYPVERIVEYLRTYTDSRTCILQLHAFVENPELYIYRWGVEMQYSSARGPNIYAGFVLLAENYATIRDDVTDNWRRFYTIGSRLPLDLQAVLAWRTVNRTAESIPDSVLKIAVAEFYAPQKS
jgi:hypothetical protein